MKRFRVCRECGELDLGSTACPFCESASLDVLPPGSAVGLTGWVGTGKTVYLATLHDQLMHAAPEWRVEVTPRAFDRLTDTFAGLRTGARPPATVPHLIASSCFTLAVARGRQRQRLVMWDAAGEMYEQYARGDSEAWGGNPGLADALAQCSSVLVTIPSFTGNLTEPSESGAKHPDARLGTMFDRLLRERGCVLRQVIFLLVGVEAYGNELDQAATAARRDFEQTYRTAPGVLKNARVAVTAVPISNFGFGNSRGFDLLGPPRPYNVLEPMRQVFEARTPTWRRLIGAMRARTAKCTPAAPAQTPPVPVPAAATPEPSAASAGRVFISYRRDHGAETARLISTELRRRGGAVFLDVEDLGASYFDDRILFEIQNAPNFVVVLTPGCLDRCHESDDWLRREVDHALQTKRRLIPVMKEQFRFPSLDALPESLRDLPRHNCVEYSHVFFGAFIDRLISFMVDDQHGEAQPPSKPEVEATCPLPAQDAPELPQEHERAHSDEGDSWVL
ncbi:MAG: TIR domain-containing protein [Armatimonadetes bacterium]|nr:TIR domain-containing protein [Armatimonadota bacterium]